MPYALEKFGHKAIVINTQTGHHFSRQPIPLASAKAQLRLLDSLSLKEKQRAK
jgi:hypothetical protein